MKLIITEKPSVARTLADCLETTPVSKEKGYLKGEKYIYSWAFGHLVSLANANQYCDDVWNLKNIPIIPNPFKLIPNPKTKEQFSILQKLISNSSEIINAADAGREGELIFRYILELSKNNTIPVKRLWISSYTNSSITKGFNNLKPQSDFDTIYYAGRSRARADWLFGINATIAITKTINNGELFSLGRVQTPTFALVCKRFLEHNSFTKTTYFIPTIELQADNITFTAALVYQDYILDKKDAIQIINSISDSIICSSVKKQDKSFNAPLCFDLTSLQIQANKTFGYTADKTLKLAQSLYEKHKALSYPRTDSKFLSKEQIFEVQALLNKFKESNNKVKDSIVSDVSNSRNFNDAKITDHHAIIPTCFKNNTADWSNDEKNLYNLVLKQFLMAFSNPATATSITYLFSEKQHTFKSSELNYTSLGWKLLENQSIQNSKLPVLTENDLVPIINRSIDTNTTKPKAIYTDASLLSAMENAGKDFDTEDLPIELKKKGIGTPATRASIIEIIIKRNFISRYGKKLIPTDFGMNYYMAIKDFDIADVKLTGKWEEKLHDIAAGNEKEKNFINLVVAELNSIVLNNIKNINTSSFSTIDKPCPTCKSKLNSSSKAISCSSDACEFILWKNFFNIKLSNTQLEALLDLKKIPIKKIITSKEKKPFNASIKLDPEKDHKVSFVFINEKTDFNCPACKTHTLSNKGTYLKCDNDTCNFTLSKIIAKKTLSEHIIKTLLETKSTPLIKGFKSNKGKSFNAKLSLDTTNTKNAISFNFK